MKWLHYLLFILLFSSCAADPILRLEIEPEEKENKELLTIQGIEYLYSEKEYSTVTISYYRHIGDRLVMDLEVTNDSPEMIQFNPRSAITYKAEKKKWRGGEITGVWHSETIDEGYAIDPERAILNTDLRASKAQAQERTTRVIDGISSSLEVVSDIKTRDYTSEARTEREQRRIRTAVESAERRENYHRKVSSFSEQRQYWEMESLRTTDLFVGDSVGGEISIPVREQATHIEIMVEVGDEKHHFTYIQRRFKP